MSDAVTEFRQLVEAFEVDYDLLMTKGNKTAAKRARMALLKIRKLTPVIRAEIQETKNAS